MMLPILNTNDAELAICAGEGVIHPEPLVGTTITPGMARKATFVASITVACQIFLASKGKSLELRENKNLTYPTKMLHSETSFCMNCFQTSSMINSSIHTFFISRKRTSGRKNKINDKTLMSIVGL
jgi:hypothetical protein